MEFNVTWSLSTSCTSLKWNTRFTTKSQWKWNYIFYTRQENKVEIQHIFFSELLRPDCFPLPFWFLIGDYLLGQALHILWNKTIVLILWYRYHRNVIFIVSFMCLLTLFPTMISNTCDIISNKSFSASKSISYLFQKNLNFNWFSLSQNNQHQSNRITLSFSQRNSSFFTLWPVLVSWWGQMPPVIIFIFSSEMKPPPSFFWHAVES